MSNQISDIKFTKVSKGNVYLAFFDILGFKEVNRNNGNDEIIAAYEDSIGRAMFAAKRFYQNIISKTKQSGLNVSEEDFKLVYTIISDSILIHTKNDDSESFFILLSSCVAFLNEFMTSGFPLRGTLTFGDLSILGVRDKEMSIDSKVLIGKPIVDAIEEEKIFNWSGCTISEKLVKYLDVHHSTWSQGMYPLVLKYPAPKSRGKISEEYVVNWVTEKEPRELWEKRFSANGKRIDSWEVKQKIDNTIKFIEFVPSILDREYELDENQRPA